MGRVKAKTIQEKIDELTKANEDWENLHKEHMRIRRILSLDLNKALKEIEIAKIALQGVHSEKKEERRKMAWDLMLMAAKGRRIDMWIAIEAWKVVDKFNESEDL